MTKSQNFKEGNAILDNQTSPSNNIEKKIVNELEFENRSENSILDSKVSSLLKNFKI